MIRLRGSNMASPSYTTGEANRANLKICHGSSDTVATVYHYLSKDR